MLRFRDARAVMAASQTPAGSPARLALGFLVAHAHPDTFTAKAPREALADWCGNTPRRASALLARLAELQEARAVDHRGGRGRAGLWQVLWAPPLELAPADPTGQLRIRETRTPKPSTFPGLNQDALGVHVSGAWASTFPSETWTPRASTERVNDQERTPPAPHAGGAGGADPPPPPAGKRKTALAAHRAAVDAWAEEHVAGLVAPGHRSAAVRSALGASARTHGEVLAHVERWWQPRHPNHGRAEGAA